MNWNDNWDNGANTHDDIEAAIKAKIQEIQDAIASGETTMGQVGQQLATLQQSINGLVPNTRTINGKRLNTNVTLKTSDLENDSGYITEDDLPEGVTVDEELDDESGHAISNAAVCEGLAAKADDNVVVKSISVNGQTPQTPTQGNVNINVQGTPGADGITPHIGQNGNWWLGDENDSENDTGVTAQGPAGTSYTSADLAIGNALNGQGDVLGMQGAMQMKANIDSLFTSLNRLYSKLGNMAFWDAADKTAAAPTALDWQVPQVTVTLDKTALSANAMITNANDQEISGTSVSVDQGSGLTLKIKPRPDHAITAASATIGGVSQNLTESNGIYTLAIASVTSAITIVFSVSAAALIPITYGTPSHCSVPSGVTNPTGILSGRPANIQYECESGYVLTSNNITISGASIGTITNVGNVYTIPITHDGTSQSISITASATVPPMKLLRGYYIGSDIITHSLAAAVTNAAVGDGSTVDVSKIVLTDYIHIDGDANSILQDYDVIYGVARGTQQDSQQGCPCIGSFFRKQNGTYKLINSWSWQGTYAYRKVTASNFTSSTIGTALLEALQAGELYVRAALYLDVVEPAALVSTVAIKWGNTGNVNTLFSASSPFVISTDPTEFDSFTYDGAPQ